MNPNPGCFFPLIQTLNFLDSNFTASCPPREPTRQTHHFFSWKITTIMESLFNQAIPTLLVPKVLKYSQQVLTTFKKPLLTLLYNVFYMDFSNLYIIRIKGTEKTFKTPVTKGFQAIHGLNYKCYFYVLTHHKYRIINFVKPLLIGVLTYIKISYWLKHPKVFTCKYFACCIFNAFFLHVAVCCCPDTFKICFFLYKRGYRK